MKAVPIITCEQMANLALNKKSVFVKQWNKPCSAAFFMGWQTGLLIGWLKRGQFTLYEKPVQPKKQFPNFNKQLTQTT